MADDLLDNTPDDDDGDDGIDLTGGNTGTTAVDADPDDDDDDPDADADTTTSTGDKPAGKTYTQADVDRIKEATRKERDANAALRRENRLLKKQQAGGSAPDATDAVAQAREEAAATEIARLKPIAIRAKAETLFLQNKLQNPTDARVSRLVRNLDMDEIDIDPDTGAITGLEDQVEALVDEFAEMFTPPAAPAADPAKPKPRIPRGDGADRRAAPAGPDKNKDTGAYLANRILNR